jgi:hypothetical protein
MCILTINDEDKQMNILAQIFGIIGFVFAVISFQEKKNKRFFIEQGLSGLFFAANFFMVGAIGAALFNFVNLIRGLVYQKSDRKVWRLVLIEALYAGCFVYSLFGIWGNTLQITLSALTYSTLVLTSIFMWLGDGKIIRYVQFLYASPGWLIHNIFNFSLGGILCESFNMISIIISFIRFGKDGFEK